MAKFIQTKDDFDPATTCGLCGAPLDADGDYDGDPHTPQSREMALRLFACDCASRALDRWVKSGREPDPRNRDIIRTVRAVANGHAPITELAEARELASQLSREFIQNERDPSEISRTQQIELSKVIREQLSWYGALNAVSCACNEDYEDAAEHAAREGRREARRAGDEQQEIAWQTKRLEKLRIITRTTMSGDATTQS